MGRYTFGNENTPFALYYNDLNELEIRSFGITKSKFDRLGGITPAKLWVPPRTATETSESEIFLESSLLKVNIGGKVERVEVMENKGVANGYAGLGTNALVPTAQLGTGVADSTKVLRGDQTWASIVGSHDQLDHLDSKKDIPSVKKGWLITGQEIELGVYKWRRLMFPTSRKYYLYADFGATGDVIWKQVDWAELSGKPTTFPPSAHVLVDVVHTASGLSVGQVVRASGANTFAWAFPDWGDIVNKPISFPPSAHATSHHSGGIDALAGQSIAGLLTTSSPTFTGLTLSGLTLGSILFAGAGGLISQDNANLFWDNINKFLGIGLANPSVRLDINSGEVRIRDKGVFTAQYDTTPTSAYRIEAFDTRMRISTHDGTSWSGDRLTILTKGTDKGKVGINHVKPTSQLQVRGDIGLGYGTRDTNEPIVIWLENGTGTTIGPNRIVIQSPLADNTFLTTTTAEDKRVIGITYENIAPGGVGRIVIGGIFQVLPMTMVSRGDHCVTSTTAGLADAKAVPATDASIGVYLEKKEMEHLARVLIR